MFRSITNNTAKNLSAGGTISGNVTIEGDLTVNGDGAGSYDEIVNGQLVAFRDDSSTVGTNDNIVIENDGTGDASLKFSLTGATDWFAYVDNSDSDKFKIRRSTSDYLIITETGNVGLAVSPSYPLHVENAADTVAYFKSTDNNGQIAVVDDDTTAYFGANGSRAFMGTASGLAGTTNLVVDSNGNVGIGTTSPSGYNALAHNLVVYENSNSGITIGSSTSGTGSLYFADGTTGDEAYKGSIEYSHSSNALSLRANSVVRFVLDTNSRMSLSNNDEGSNNTVFGYKAGNAIASGTEGNVIIGHNSGLALNGGDANVAIGADALKAGTTGIGNTVVGTSAADALAFGETGNVAIGYQSMSSLNEGANVSASADNNIAIGQSALLGGAFAGNDKVVNDNIAIGAFALDATSDNSHTGLIAIGRDALGALTSGGSNIAIGYESQLYQTDGSNNVSLGFKALRNADNGESFNTAIGTKAGEFINHASSDGNTIVGMQAMVGGTGARSYNVALCFRAMGSSNSQNNVGGNENVFIGAYSGNGTWTTAGCDLNTAVGYQSMQGAMNGALQNSAFGANSLGGVTSGDNNVGVGFKAGFTGTDNVTTGEQNTLIGASTQATASGAVNQTVIGYGAISQSNNSVTLGNSSVTSIFAPTKTAIQSYGTVAITDGSTITLAGSNLGAAILCIYEASGGIGGVFALSYQFAAVQLAGSSDTSTSDSAGDVCVINGTNNHTVTIKNNTGAQKNFRIMIYSAAFN